MRYQPVLNDVCVRRCRSAQWHACERFPTTHTVWHRAAILIGHLTTVCLTCALCLNVSKFLVISSQWTFSRVRTKCLHFFLSFVVFWQVYSQNVSVIRGIRHIRDISCEYSAAINAFVDKSLVFVGNLLVMMLYIEF